MSRWAIKRATLFWCTLNMFSNLRRGVVQLRRGLHGLLAGPLCVGPGGRPGGVAAQCHPLHEDNPSKEEFEERRFVADGSSESWW
ncbi:hypothetical protein CEXT_537621 [Caerostris extrusa]|uniref:Secreted protein n=1 Tax=Caerostris extrusa TaxID=172846 RepID=A0AAV4UE86_CAEEX|nr:hypothetical protein CEXT_537621 [Caerostris extrusa]